MKEYKKVKTSSLFKKLEAKNKKLDKLIFKERVNVLKLEKLSAEAREISAEILRRKEKE